MSGNNNPSLPRDVGANSSAAADDEVIAQLLMTLREGPGGPSSAGPSNAAPAPRQPTPEQVLMWANIQQHIATRTPTTPPIKVICAICHVELVVPGLQEMDCDREDAKVLKCGHVFGLDCLWVWIAEKYDAPGGVPCPACRKPLPREDVDASDDDDYPQANAPPSPPPPQDINVNVHHAMLPNNRQVNPLMRIAPVPQTLIPPPLGLGIRRANPLQRIAAGSQTVVSPPRDASPQRFVDAGTQTLPDPPRSVPQLPPSFPISSVRTEPPAPARRPAVLSQSVRLMRHYAARRADVSINDLETLPAPARSVHDQPPSPTSSASTEAPAPARRPVVLNQSARLMRHYAAMRSDAAAAETLSAPSRSVPDQPADPTPSGSTEAPATAPAPARRPAVVSQSARLMRHYAALRQQRRSQSPPEASTSADARRRSRSPVRPRDEDEEMGEYMDDDLD